MVWYGMVWYGISQHLLQHSLIEKMERMTIDNDFVVGEDAILGHFGASSFFYFF